MTSLHLYGDADLDDHELAVAMNAWLTALVSPGEVPIPSDKTLKFLYLIGLLRKERSNLFKGRRHG